MFLAPSRSDLGESLLKTTLLEIPLGNPDGKTPTQLEVTPMENVSAVTTRGGKSTREPPFPQDAGTRCKTVTASQTDIDDEVQEEAVESNASAT